MNEAPQERTATRPPAVVLGSGLTALGTKRSLAAANIPSLLVDNASSIASRSRWARNRTIHHPESADPSNLVDLLDKLTIPDAVLMPCSDNWTTAVASLPESARGRFKCSMPSRQAVALLADKARLAETLTRLEVNHPWTLVISSEEDFERVPEERWQHVFLKPTDSQAFSRQFGMKAFSVSGRADAVAKYRTMREAGIGAVAQEYIPGSSSRHFFIDGFIDRTGRISALFSRQRTRMYPRDYGNSTFMVSVPLDSLSPAIADLERLLSDLKYRGIFSAEFKHDPRDESYRLLEVNIRPWWYVEFATLNGINVCEMAYLDALGTPVPERFEFPVGARHMLMPDEIYAFWSYRRGGDLTLREWSREVRGASDALFRRDDLRPAMSAVAGLPARALRKARRKLTRRT